MSKKKKKPFKVITDAPAFRARLGELSGNELKVWMYLWLRTNGELTAFPGNDTVARELGVNIDTVKDAKRGLREKGWTTRENQRTRDDGTFSTVVEKVHLPWGKKASTDTVVEKTDDGKLHQQKEYSVNPEVSPSADSGTQNPEGEKQLVSKQISVGDSLRSSLPTDTEKATPKGLQADKAEEQQQNQTEEWTPNPAFSHPCFSILQEEFEGWDSPESIHLVHSYSVLWQMDTEELRSLIRWALEHKFWKTRIVGIASLAKAMGKPDDKSLVAQFRRADAVARRRKQAKRTVEANPLIKTVRHDDGAETHEIVRNAANEDENKTLLALMENPRVRREYVEKFMWKPAPGNDSPCPALTGDV